MLIKKEIKKFIVFREDTILDALLKIDENKHAKIGMALHNLYSKNK